MENSGNGLAIQNISDTVVVEFIIAQENVTVHLHQMAAQIVLVTELKHVNVLQILVL